MGSSAPHYYGLDVLRFAAAMLVLLNHFATYALDAPMVVTAAEARAFPFLSVFEHLGAVGVQVFFVISGFVIPMSAAELVGSDGARCFMRARFWRIVPALWISTGIGGLILLSAGISPGQVLERALKSALLLPIGPYVDGVVWTLLLEVVFYIGIAVLVVRGRVQIKQAACWLGTLSTIFILLLVVGKITGFSDVAHLKWFPLKVLLLHHGVFFALGMLLWAHLCHGQSLHWRAVILFGLVGCVQIFTAMMGDPPKGLWACVIFIAAIGCLVRSVQRDGLCSRTSKMARFLGDLSYPLYLNHFTLGMYLTWATSGLGASPIGHCAVVMWLVLGVSVFVLLLERGLRHVRQPRGIFRTRVRPPLT